MTSADTTCWTTIEAAGRGEPEGRAEFAVRYESPIRAYLQARWRGNARLSVDDAVQEAFVQFFGSETLRRANRNASGGFRAYLYGVVRNVARKFETRQSREPSSEPFQPIVSDETSLSHVYDRTWAKCIMQQAAQQQMSLARKKGSDAVRRVELLHLRFHDGLPIRQIAKLWGKPASWVHHQYAAARREFQAALEIVISRYGCGTPADVKRECNQLALLLA